MNLESSEDYGYATEDELYTCSVCEQEDIDPFDSTRHEVEGCDVCGDCIKVCYGCGEAIDDCTAIHGKHVTAPVWALDQRLKDFHAECLKEHEEEEAAQKGAA